MRLPLRFIPRGIVVPVIQGPMRGTKWIVGSSVHGCWLGSYEYIKQKLFVEMIHQGNVVFDIGANVGFYSLLASKLVGSDGQVFAFEPLPSNLVFLEKHIAINHLKNVRVFAQAVGKESGDGFFIVPGDNSSGRLAHNNQGFQVSVVSLDDLFEKGHLPLPNAIKIDVEGAELDVLEGARRLLQQSKPTIFLATHSPELNKACSNYLENLGFVLKPVIGTQIECTDELLAQRR